MADKNFGKTTTIDLTDRVPDYMQESKNTDGVYGQEENKWTNTNASKYYGFYYGVGEYRAALDSFGTWVMGQGYETENVRDKVTLDHVSGVGEDTFLSLLFNHVVTKKFNGDAYMEIVTDNGKPIPEGKLINLKTLDPIKMAHITNEKGIIIRYEYTQGNGEIKKLDTNMVFHSMNNRILDEPHGTAMTSAVEWVIEKIQQAREDFARLMHVSSVRILYVDENDTAKQEVIKTQYAKGLKNGDVIMMTCKPEDAKFEDLTVPGAVAWIMWLDYLEDKFYKQLGVPKVTLGGTAENTEASAKVGVLVYEPVWTREILELEADVWNQLGIKIKINKQPSLGDNLKQQEQKNNAQTGFQPSDTQVNNTPVNNTPVNIEGER